LRFGKEGLASITSVEWHPFSAFLFMKPRTKNKKVPKALRPRIAEERSARIFAFRAPPVSAFELISGVRVKKLA
jgi:hypothetical protein